MEICKKCPLRRSYESKQLIVKESCDHMDECARIYKELGDIDNSHKYYEIPMSSFPDGVEEKIYYQNYTTTPNIRKGLDIDIKALPWQALSNKETNIVKLFYLENKSQEEIAKRFELTQPRITKIIKRCVNLIQEYSFYIECLNNNRNVFTSIQQKYLTLFYVEGLTIKQIAEQERKQKRSIQRVLSNGRKKANRVC